MKYQSTRSVERKTVFVDAAKGTVWAVIGWISFSGWAAGITIGGAILVLFASILTAIDLNGRITFKDEGMKTALLVGVIAAGVILFGLEAFRW